MKVHTRLAMLKELFPATGYRDLADRFNLEYFDGTDITETWHIGYALDYLRGHPDEFDWECKYCKKGRDDEDNYRLVRVDKSEGQIPVSDDRRKQIADGRVSASKGAQTVFARLRSQTEENMSHVPEARKKELRRYLTDLTWFEQRTAQMVDDFIDDKIAKSM